ncbi:hypothetical protein NFI96_010418 [Prochilodus magdalenae]|nr:hypothetical protein NFI96_010418 [Prochilodus magdalenae]
MGKSKEISQDIRKRIVDLHKSGSSLGAISRCLKVPRSSVQTIIRKYKKDGNVQPSYRSGRKKVLCPRDERALVRSVHINPRAKAKDLVNMMAEAGGTGALHKIDGIMRKEHYVEILKQHLKTSARKLKLGRKWIFQMNNDPKHTAKLVTKWLKDNKVNVLEWPSQSPDLNPIENLWAKLKRHVRARRPTNMAQLHQFCQEEWAKIPANYCEKLVEGYPKRLTQVIQFKGNSTKY